MNGQDEVVTYVCEAEYEGKNAGQFEGLGNVVFDLFIARHLGALWTLRSILLSTFTVEKSTAIVFVLGLLNGLIAELVPDGEEEILL